MASVIMVGCAFDTLDPLTAGVEYNTVSKQITADRVYTSGRYFLGLGRAFLEFPMNFQVIEYSTAADADEPPLIARSIKGQIVIECSLQYTLQLDRLVTVYRNYELQYHEKFVKIAQNAIKNKASEFDPDQFYQQRILVGQEMEREVRTALLRENAIVHDFQLRKVELPQQNEQKIIDKIVAVQKVKTAGHVQDQERIKGQTTVVTALETQKIQIFQANQTRAATIITQTAAAQGKAVQLGSQSKAYAVLQQGLGLSVAELLRYIWLGNLRSNMAGSTLAVGFKSATLSAK